MKSIIHYLFLVILVAVVGAEILYTIQQDSLLQYSTSEDMYVSNNPNGVTLSTEIIEEIEKTDNLLIIAEDVEGYTQISDFSYTQLTSGQIPISKGEYLAPENTSEICEAEGTTQVGVYAETLNFNGFGCLFFLDSLDKVSVVQIQASHLADSELAELLTEYGFLEVSSENIDKVVRSDMLSMMTLILRIFIGLLLIAGVVGWLTLAGGRASDEKSNIQMLQHLGGSSVAVSWAYVTVNKKAWLSVSSIHILIYLIVACIANYFSISSRPYLFVVAWLGTVIGIVTSFLILVMCVSYLRPLPTIKFPAYSIEVLLVCVGIGGWYLSNNPFSLIIAIVLVLLLQLRKHSIIDVALFSKTGVTSGAIFSLLTLVTISTTAVLAVLVSCLDKAERAIETSLPYSAQLIVREYIPEEIEDDLYQHYYINPVDGIEYEGVSFFPLIYSTELSKYQPYLDNDDVLSSESILVGRGLATKSGIEVGDVITVNDIQVTVTHIVNTEQYGSMMMYMSDEKFIELFGNSGTVYYFTDLSTETLEQYFSDSTILDRDTYREYYDNSIAELLIILAVFCLILVVISTILVYALLSLFLNSIEWKVNLLRGFGLAKSEFAASLTKVAAVLCLASLFVCIVLSEPITSLLTTLILDFTDSYFELVISWEVIITILVVYVVLCFALVIPRVLKLNNLSIYQQYLRTRPKV